MSTLFWRSLKTVPESSRRRLESPKHKGYRTWSTIFTPVGRSEDFSGSEPECEPALHSLPAGARSMLRGTESAVRRDALNGDDQVRHDRRVLSTVPSRWGREPCPLLGGSTCGARPRGPRRIFARSLGPQTRTAGPRRRRGRRCDPTSDQGGDGALPAAERVDLRRASQRPEASPTTRRRSPPGHHPLPQPLPARTRPDQRPERGAEDVHGPRLLGPLPEERPVQVQSAPLREADVSDLSHHLREAAATLALPALRAHALRRTGRRDRAERLPSGNDCSLSPRARRPHPELRTGPQSVGSGEFSGRLLPLRRPPRVLQRHPGARGRGDPVPRTASVRRRREGQPGPRPRGGPGPLGPSRAPWLASRGGTRCDLCAGPRAASPFDLVRERATRRVRSARMGDADPRLRDRGAPRDPPWRNVWPDDPADGGRDPRRNRAIRGRGSRPRPAEGRPHGL